MSTRPVLDSFRRTPWVSAIPFDGEPLGRLIPRQVQIAFQGTGPPSTRRLVPLTPAAHELLYGQSRTGARQALRGALATLDDAPASVDLRGISMSTDTAGFAANLLLSNIESGWTPNSVRSGDRTRLERDIVEDAAPAANVAKAQNTGWLDLGPRVSRKLESVMRFGRGAGLDAAEEVGLTLAHELQHSISPQRATGIDPKLVWLEEGSAETLAWWPQVATGIMRRMGVPATPGRELDPYTAPPDSTASADYRQHHRGVLSLLSMAGVHPWRADGSVDAVAGMRARELLQGDSIEGVPRDLARAIVRAKGLRSEDVPAVEELILESSGKPESLRQLGELVGQRTAPPASNAIAHVRLSRSP